MAIYDFLRGEYNLKDAPFLPMVLLAIQIVLYGSGETTR